ncbi:MAG TPA: SPFH domain-containing protein, partial [Nitrosopumilus sp.]|nr:SPFH domain-containing protein [Nitrosopumilus sp.]
MSKYQSPKVNVNMGPMKVILVAILLLIIIGVVASASVKIVDAGNRGVLLHWNAVDLTAPPLDEGIHFVIPFQDDIVQLEVRTLKYDAETRSASKDLQTVETTVTVNYNPDKERVHILYKEIGLDYENRVIQ